MSSPQNKPPAETLMAYLDGELSDQGIADFEKLLDQHPEWRAEVEEMAAVVGATNMVRLRLPGPEAWDHYWEEIDARIEKRLGWGFLSAGSILLIGIGTWKVLYHTEDPWVKTGLVLVILGIVVLFAAVLRGRLAELPHDRYRRIRR